MNQASGLIKQVKEYIPNLDEGKIVKAWNFAKNAHVGQKRRSGEDYIEHPLEVAKTLAHWKLDEASVIAGLLHDTVEDTDKTLADIENNFGAHIARIVNGVTKVTDLKWSEGREEGQIENLRKMILVMSRDLRVVFVKLADRMHNMRTLHALSEDKQKANSRETLEIYAPLAERLGIGEAKQELEELSFRYLYPTEYKDLVARSLPLYKRVEKIIDKASAKIAKKLREENVESEISGRKKSLYSLWRKLARPEIDGDISKINDIIAMRILVEKVSDCYIALGIVHSIFKPAPKLGISDFIAQPKPNGYRSIHTKVFTPEGRIIEIQIRTHQMHEEAEHGACAHWAYGEAKQRGAKDEKLEKGLVKNKLNWVKELVEWQKELVDSHEFLDAVRFDAFSHRNFVFSPKGDVYDLPRNATPVDYAFSVHTGLGDYIKGAKVNGKIVSLGHKLVSGDIIEILKSRNPVGVRRDWLNFVVTNAARQGIRKQLRKVA